MIKTGIFGGAFNPPHKGHINLAKEAIEQLKLRKLLVIPTFESPHKATKLAPFEERAEMCRRAFSGISDKCEVEICEIERELGGVSYTINTLRALKKRYEDARFFLLIGGDMLFSFTEWFKYESILKECEVCAAARGGDSFSEMLEYATEIGHIKVLPTNVVDISSTEIREKIQKGEDASEWITEDVRGYIEEKGLYR
ncbi:MAG: nicotinate (nicotinamide) nucleotide adenylyltransferase [Oscillospiraceae bacterium]|nr:nicotinate (nicotinamide) nucleotide adenylyltransferase [Oscillospiraceae bacterium]